MQRNLNSERPHPQVNIPPDARQLVKPPLVEQYASYAFEVTYYSASTAHPTPQQNNNNGYMNGLKVEPVLQ